MIPVPHPVALLHLAAVNDANLPDRCDVVRPLTAGVPAPGGITRAGETTVATDLPCRLAPASATVVARMVASQFREQATWMLTFASSEPTVLALDDRVTVRIDGTGAPRALRIVGLAPAHRAMRRVYAADA